MSDFHLVCVQPFGKYVKGQMITDPREVDELQEDRDHHFVRIYIPAIPLAFAGPADEPAPTPLVVKKDK